MSNAKSSKGNPAHKRMSNPNNAAKRARSWKRGEARKERNRQAQRVREQANRVLVAGGDLTAHAALNERNAHRPRRAVKPQVHHPVHTLEFVPSKANGKNPWQVTRITDGVQAALRHFKTWEEARAFLDIANAWL